MADISMCKGENCLLKESCYRFLAEPNTIRQTYLSESPYNKETKSCTYYWKVSLKNNKIIK